MIYPIRTIALFLLALGALIGCASVEPPKPAAPVVAAPVRKEAPRELGSLWSQDSTWNYVYSAAAARVVGDLVTIRLDDAFKKRIVQYKPPVEAVEETAAAEKPDAKGDAKPDGGADATAQRAPAAAEPKEKSDSKVAKSPDLLLKGVIEEVGPRGTYRIAAVDTVQIDGWQPYVTLKARVRDRDVSSSDEILASNLVDISLDVTGLPAQSEEDSRSENVSW